MAAESLIGKSLAHGVRALMWIPEWLRNTKAQGLLIETFATTGPGVSAGKPRQRDQKECKETAGEARANAFERPVMGDHWIVNRVNRLSRNQRRKDQIPSGKKPAGRHWGWHGCQQAISHGCWRS